MPRHLLFFILMLPLCTALAGESVTLDFGNTHVATPYPGTVKANLTRNADGYLIRKTPDMESICAYFYVTIPAAAKAIKYALTYKTTPSANPQVLASFNKQGGPNGGNGMKTIHFPTSTEWTTREVLIDVPAETAVMQSALSARANAYEMAFRSVKVTFIADAVAVGKAPEGFSAATPPAQWTGVADLEGFYTCVSAAVAGEQTDIKLTYDDRNLYVGTIARLTDPQTLRAEVNDPRADAGIFSDDCLELFLSAPVRNLAWQFATNPNGSRFDAEVRQNMPGDPWKVFGEWNGEWTVVNFRDGASWQAVFTIPWKTIGFTGIPGNPIGFNAGRENKAGGENSQWNAFDGSFHAVEKYACLDLVNGRIERTRRTDRMPYLINRPNPQFEALLGTEPGGYVTGTWGAAFISTFPERIRRLYSAEEEMEWQTALLDARGDAGMLGPPLPWANSSIFGGWKRMREYTQRFGTRFPYVLFNSAVSRGAIQHGAKYYCGESGVDPACDAYREYVVNGLTELTTKYYYKDYLDTVGLVFGIDEPTNSVPNIFSRTRNHGLAAALDEADAEIKASTGFGTFGLHDAFAEPTPDVEFERIAFWRWWNRNFARFCREVQAKVREVFPGVEFKSIDRNTVSGVCPTDVALLTPYSDWISCDPYPTSTAGDYGRSRALFHPGFSAKMLGDLACQSKLCVTPQNFIYHGGRPEPAEIREWASQCMKVGAQMLYWYIESPDTLMNMWDGNLEVLAINKQLKTLRKIIVPKRTASAILHSDWDRWGLADNVLHPAYSLYTLLGEQNKAWFRFISPTGLASGVHRLGDYSIVYIPRMKFTDPETTARMVAFLNGGGTVVCFDPEFLRSNLDGSAVPERASLFGAELTPRTLQTPALRYLGKDLPIFEIANLPGPLDGTFQAFRFGPLPADAKVLATYAEDGSPAIIERLYGQGKVILSAVQPFGNSDVALRPTAWQEFTAALCRSVGEPMDLPIWDFVLKKLPENEVTFTPLIKW
jgi:hypothetical protein